MPFLRTNYYRCKEVADAIKKSDLEKSGNFKYCPTSGGIYTGGWVRNLRHGKGIFLKPRGKLYEGDFEANNRHGYGVKAQRKPTKAKLFDLRYAGEWQKGLKHGLGLKIYKLENGEYEVYFGNFEHGKRNGRGEYWYATGAYYYGEWKNDDKNGEGIYLNENLDYYEGSWEKGKKNGYGRYFHLKQGTMQEGIWIHGICKGSTITQISYRQSAVEPMKYLIPPLELANCEQLIEDRKGFNLVKVIMDRYYREELFFNFIQ